MKTLMHKTLITLLATMLYLTAIAQDEPPLSTVRPTPCRFHAQNEDQWVGPGSNLMLAENADPSRHRIGQRQTRRAAVPSLSRAKGSQATGSTVCPSHRCEQCT